VEAFLAVLQLDRGTERAVESMAEAGIGMVQSSDTYVERFNAPGIAVTVQKRSHASDTYFGRINNNLYYVQGWVEPQEKPSAGRPAHWLAEDKVLPASLLGNNKEAAGLTGSFHVVGYDFDTRHLTVFVDRVASRPVFYYQDGAHLILSSDIRAILGVPGIDCTVDIESLAQFVRIQTILGDRTLYRHIGALMPATALRTQPQRTKVEIKRYWIMEPLDPFVDEEEAIRGVAAAFRKAGGRITHGNQRGAVLLSGGLDSRLVLAIARSSTEALEAFTFGPEVTDEGRVARSVARSLGVPWHFVAQSAADYWQQLESVLPTLQAQYSVAHTHPFRTARLMAERGADTIYHGLELCVTFSGSYLPKEYKTLRGRRLYTYRLAPLSTRPGVKKALLDFLDIQSGKFQRSFLAESLQEPWNTAAVCALGHAVDEAAEKWDDPYDWYEKGMLNAGFSKFRSYVVGTCNRAVARERSPMPDSDVIDAYLRLTVHQRFLGPIYRRSLHRINPRLARILYANIGTSPLAPPVVQATALQVRQFGRANRDRLRRLLGKLGLGALLQEKFYGSYPTPSELAQALALGNLPTTAATRRALTGGFLAQNSIIDARRLRKRLDEGDFTDDNEAWTILALASLAAWFDKYPAGTGVQGT